MCRADENKPPTDPGGFIERNEGYLCLVVHPYRVSVSASVIAWYLSAVGAFLRVIIFAAGYYLLYKVYKRMTDDM